MEKALQDYGVDMRNVHDVVMIGGFLAQRSQDPAGPNWLKKVAGPIPPAFCLLKVRRATQRSRHLALRAPPPCIVRRDRAA